ncbi:hypothetical protein ACRAWD_18450 [Caulobacter segnis]
MPPLVDLAAKAREDYGDTYCGGQIEASLRKVLDAWGWRTGLSPPAVLP